MRRRCSQSDGFPRGSPSRRRRPSPDPPYSSGIRTERKPSLRQTFDKGGRIGALAVERAPVFARENRGRAWRPRRESRHGRPPRSWSLRIVSLSPAACGRSFARSVLKGAANCRQKQNGAIGYARLGISSSATHGSQTAALFCLCERTRKLHACRASPRGRAAGAQPAYSATRGGMRLAAASAQRPRRGTDRGRAHPAWNMAARCWSRSAGSRRASGRRRALRSGRSIWACRHRSA